MTFALVNVQWLCTWLPGCGPEIAAFIVTKIYVTSRGVVAVEVVTDNSSVGTALYEAVTACVVGNNSAISRGT